MEQARAGSVLHERAFAGRMEQIAYLLGKGVNLETRDHCYGATAERWARCAGKNEIAEFLLARGSG